MLTTIIDAQFLWSRELSFEGPHSHTPWPHYGHCEPFQRMKTVVGIIAATVARFALLEAGVTLVAGVGVNA